MLPNYINSNNKTSTDQMFLLKLDTIDVLFNKIERKYISCDTVLVINCSFKVFIGAVCHLKQIFQFKHQSYLICFDMVKIYLIIINTLNIFTMYESLL